MSAKYRSPSFLLPNNVNANKQSNYSFTAESGSGKYFDFGTELWDLIKSSNEFSISWWCKVPSGAGINGDFVPFNFGTELQASGSQSQRLWLAMGGGSTIFKIRNNNTVVLEYSNPPTDVWTHYVFSVKIGSNTADQILYKDGQPVATTSSAITSISSSSSFFYINQYYRSNYTGVVGGSFDEYSFFTRALDSNEISALYGGTSPNIYPSNLMAANLNPVAYYPLGEQAQNSGYPSATGNEWQFPNGVLQDYVMDFGSSVGKFISLPNEISLSGEFAMSFWLKPTASNINLLGNFNNTNYVYVNPSNQVDISSSDIAQTFSSTVISSTSGNWQNLLITRDSSNVFRTYVNGDIKNTVTDPGTFSFNQIGRYYNVSTNDYRGEMSNVAIWNTDQSTNVANIYNNGSPQTTYTVTPQNWWQLQFIRLVHLIIQQL